MLAARGLGGLLGAHGSVVVGDGVGALGTRGAVAAAATTARGLLGLLLGSGLLALGLEDLLLLGDLVEQARHGGDGLGRVVAHAVLLLLFLALALGLGAGLLGLLALCLGTGALGLAALLGLDTLLLGAGALLGLGLGAGLLLGLLGRLDLCGAGLEDGRHLLADDHHVGVLESARGGLGRDHHVGQVAEHLLARHAKFLGKVMYASLCHVAYLPVRATVWAGRARG